MSTDNLPAVAEDTSTDYVELITRNPVAAYFNNHVFELGQRAATMLSKSNLTPKRFQNSVADCHGALVVAARMGLTPWEVMQNLYVVHGQMAWSSKFLIARMESSGRYAVLDYEIVNDPAGSSEPPENWACRMYGVLSRKVHDQVVRVDGPWISYGMAYAAGWVSRKDSYWKVEPELMLRYRAAARFASVHHPGASLGFLTREEMSDMGEAEREADQRSAADLSERLRAAATAVEEPPIIEGEAHEEDGSDLTQEDQK